MHSVVLIALAYLTLIGTGGCGPSHRAIIDQYQVIAVTPETGVIESDGVKEKYTVGGRDVFRSTYWGRNNQPAWAIGGIGSGHHNPYPRVISADLSSTGQLAIVRHDFGVSSHDYRTGIATFQAAASAKPVALCWAGDSLMVLEAKLIGFRTLAHQIVQYDKGGTETFRLDVTFDKYYQDSAFHDRFCASWDGGNYVVFGVRTIPANRMEPRSYVVNLTTRETHQLNLTSAFFTGPRTGLGNSGGREQSVSRFEMTGANAPVVSDVRAPYESDCFVLAATFPKTGAWLAWTGIRGETAKGVIRETVFSNGTTFVKLAQSFDSRQTLMIRPTSAEAK